LIRGRFFRPFCTKRSLRAQQLRSFCAKGTHFAVLLVAGVAMSGCFGICEGGSAPAGARPSPVPSVPAVPDPSYLVLQVTPTGARTMNLFVVDLHGQVAAKTTFTPPATPQFANCQSVVQPAVRAAGGAAYFADSKGVIHRLDTGGKLTTVATFKLSSKQQFLSYAVSPDGSRLMASIVAATPNGKWTMDLETASAGGATTTVRHVDLGSDPSPGAMVITGWDTTGPVATTDADVCVAFEPPTPQFAGASLVHLSSSGQVLDRIGGPSCIPLDELPDGTALCAADRYACKDLTVRSAAGEEMWRTAVKCPVAEPHLAPDGQSVAAQGLLNVVYRRDSAGRPASFAREQQPDRLSILGWAGSGHVVVVRDDGELGLANPRNPLVFAGMGFNIGAQSQVLLAGTLA
jgi:hypothetical protein